eukprot:TRINITY_DN15453_c0_g1_i2.p1 TRINITY_DN15453_c0_g1~~TRINITY_DN15453_c0_g1_i2.p1  ORF type:complete len:345 (+),score=79.13 TRINITY_DN15453_c0_g1_i2:69-1103(+)
MSSCRVARLGALATSCLTSLTPLLLPPVAHAEEAKATSDDVAAAAVASEAAKGCTITVKACKNFPEYHRSQFRDSLGETHKSAGSNEAACLKRAEDFHHWCGNEEGMGAQVAATYNPQRLSQIYHPGACEKGWSQWDAFCFKHYWEKRNWFEAERLCRDRDAHLASIHSQAENRFIYTLTHGLSAWIGYTDIDQDTHYTWSDNTQDDFTNFAKNCTGREHEPDCKPEEKAQQWYDWNGGDEGTFMCKRNVKVPVNLLKNITAGNLTAIPWETLLPAIAGALSGQAGDAGAGAVAALPDIKTQELPSAKAGDAAKAQMAGEPAASGLGAKDTLAPKIRTPKGALR